MHEIARDLNDRIPGATATTLIEDDLVSNDYGLPRSWLIQIHRWCRRHKGDHDHMRYNEYSDDELFDSICVKLNLNRDRILDQPEERAVPAIYNAICKRVE